MLFVANWKMNKSFSDEVAFVQKYRNELSQLGSSEKKIVICPSYPSLFPITQALCGTSVAVGAQNCSSYPTGSYTGQVSALSLKQVGCTYCIVGHSEQRLLGKEDQEIAQAVALLIEQRIIPIICIGEENKEASNAKTFEILSKQLTPLIPYLGKSPSVIAYEPIWAIGIGAAAPNDYLATIFSWLRDKKISQCQFIYGGSVDETNITQLAALKQIEGFLIGGASLDFQKFQKIVSLS
jgi:triosephosphate isomerase